MNTSGNNFEVSMKSGPKQPRLINSSHLQELLRCLAKSSSSASLYSADSDFTDSEISDGFEQIQGPRNELPP